MAINVYLVQVWDILGVPFYFMLAVGVQIVLLLFFLRELLRVLRTPLKICFSIFTSGLRGALENSYVTHFKERHPDLFRTIAMRFSLKYPTGLYLTLGIVAAGTFLWLFLAIIEDVVFNETFVAIDERILNLIPSIRTTFQTNFFRFITFWANWQSIVFMAIVISLLLMRKKRFVTTRIFLLLIGVTQLCSTSLKHLIGRVRPEQYLSLVVEPSASFPSGHTLTATVIFGFIAYLIIKGLRSHLNRVFVFLTYVFMVFLVGVSRVYLGAHYPSDVVGSVVFGAFILSIFITLFEINQRYGIFKRRHVIHPNHDLLIAPVLGIIFAFFANSYFIPLRTVQAETKPYEIQTVNEKTVQFIPHYSETLTGARMAPISFLFVGEQGQLEDVFIKNGWYKADEFNIASGIQAVTIGIQNKQYLNGPVTPSYLNAKPHDIAFEQPSETNNFRQRHHIRWWKTNYILPGNKPLWVATASFDDNVKFVPGLMIPTHSIDPNIDGERDYTAHSIGITDPTYIQVVPAQIGKNGAGDQFFTDGKAILLMPK